MWVCQILPHKQELECQGYEWTSLVLKRLEVLQENHRGVSQQVEIVNSRSKGPIFTLPVIWD